ncbi:MAG: hypothetical protein COA78_35760 [Blastopirellula sp.]|nr:MAG: hypothetical protein COA78_35760 [Blastopirellula sp.]
MNITKYFLLILFAFAISLTDVNAEDHLKFGELIFEDHFERNESQETKDEPGNGWTTSSDPNKNGAKNVDLRDGTLHIATPQGSGHGISARHGFSFKDGTISVRVKLHDKDDRLRLNFADLPPENVGVNHLGAKHLFDAIITLDYISFEDKIGGVLSPGIIENRKKGSLTKEQKKFLATKYKVYRHKLEPDKWYTFAVHLDGDKISAHLDDKYIGELRSSGFDNPTKTLMRMLVQSTVTIDDFMVWRRK